MFTQTDGSRNNDVPEIYDSDDLCEYTKPETDEKDDKIYVTRGDIFTHKNFNETFCFEEWYFEEGNQVQTFPDIQSFRMDRFIEYMNGQRSSPK